MNYWHIYHFILVIGATQGIVLGISLITSSTQKKLANRFLAAILFFFAYRLIVEALRSLGVVGVHSWTYHVFLEFNWVYGALIYFYIRSYIEPDFKLQKQDWIHFIPVIFEITISIFVKSQNFYWDGTRESISVLGYHAYIFWMHMPSQVIIFSGLILYYVYQSKKLVTIYTADNTRLVQSEDIHWLEVLLHLYTIFACLVIAISLADYFFYDYAFNPFYIIPVYIAMAILTYWLGLQGYAKRTTPFLQKKKSHNVEVSETFHEGVEQLSIVMKEQKLFTNPKLTLDELAMAVNLKPYQLTQVLNGVIHKNFSDYVNEFRVKEAIKLINDPDYNQYTLLAIAYESGFNSKATFNRIIKKMTRKSPKQLRLKKA